MKVGFYTQGVCVAVVDTFREGEFTVAEHGDTRIMIHDSQLQVVEEPVPVNYKVWPFL